jgi:lipid II:glycine glycyltransferase (peptidoglycan interpeptide bridge formation enzyme)
VGRLDTVWSSELSATDAEAYDSFVAAARGGHYSQTRSWAKVATAAKPFVARYFLARRDGRVVAAALILRTQILRTLTLPFAQVERGPVCDDPEQMPDVLESLVGQTRRHGILRLSVMPYWAGDVKPRVERILKQHGFVDRQSFAGRHARSLRLDLASLPADELFAGSALSQVRQNIRRAERAGAIARHGQKRDLIAFRDMHEQLLRLEGKRPPAAAWYEALAEYFLSCEERGAMFVCEHQGSVVAAIFVACHGAVATYVMGASSGDELRFPKMVLPLAGAIAWAKRSGLLSFDLGGIPMAGDVDAKRTSIAEFKHSFSRAEIALVHEHVRWF